MNSFVTSNVNSYIYKLGHFWQSFNNIELFLRLYLHTKEGGNRTDFLIYNQAEIGVELPKNAITDFRSFGQLCDAFNAQQSKDKIEFNEFIELRDAMAHGRVSGDDFGNMQVVKFSKPINGIVKVEYKRELTQATFNELIQKLEDIIFEITRCMGAKMLEGFAPK